MADTGFLAFHANHPEDLRDIVVHLAKTHPLPPLQAETYIVQSNGIAQWLRMALAQNPDQGGLGIAASVDFQLPSAFVWKMYRAFLPPQDVPTISPFDKSPLTWRLFATLPAWLSKNPRFQSLRRYLDGPDPTTRLYQLSQQISDLFDQYQMFRADWLNAWEQGLDVLIDHSGRQQPIPDDHKWQAALWRDLVSELGDTDGHQGKASRSQVHVRFLQHLAGGHQPENPTIIPKRIVVFGVSSISQSALEVLHALSRHTQVVFCVHNPSRFHWADIFSDREVFQTVRQRRGLDHPLFATELTESQRLNAANPLLAVWGKQGRDTMRLLDQFDDPNTYNGLLPTPDGKADLFRPYGDDHPGILTDIQNDILELHSMHEIQGSRAAIVSSDRTLQFHQAHSPQREVEVLHDQLLAALNADAELDVSDIIVMVPDINQYAPHIKAVFERYSRQDPRYLPYAVTDQGQRQNNPLVAALDTLLSLDSVRFTASQILGLLEVPSIRQRFGMGESDLPRLRQWIEQSHTCWGLDAVHRHQILPAEHSDLNTWKEGLKRMLLGYAMTGEQTWQGITPFQETSGLSAVLVGRLKTLIDALSETATATRDEKTCAQWASRLASIQSDFFDCSDRASDQALLERVSANVDRWQTEVDTAGCSDQPMPLMLAREMALQGLDESSLNIRFMAGRITFATLMPMRAIPFKQVCLLGLNDGDYPRARKQVDFDLMAANYRPGDRSRRADDLYLFLEALLSARQCLYISWVGRSIQDDSTLPPSVLVEQLRDYVDGVWGAGTCKSLTTVHPLQSFSPSYYLADSPMADSFTYDDQWLSAYRPAAAETPSGVLAIPERTEPMTLAEMSKFAKNPIEAFFEKRLQVFLKADDWPDLDNERFALNHLEQWKVNDEINRQCVEPGLDEAAFKRALNAYLDQQTAAGALGQQSTNAFAVDDLVTKWLPINRAYQALVSGKTFRPDQSVRIDLSLQADQQSMPLIDQVSGFFESAEGLTRIQVASKKIMAKIGAPRLRPEKVLEHWVPHLAVNAMGTPLTTYLVCQSDSKYAVFHPMSPDTALDCLNQLYRGWLEGQSRPLPLHPEAICRWLESEAKGEADKSRSRFLAALAQAQRHVDPYLNRAFPDATALWQPAEISRWGHAMYQPILTHSSAEVVNK